MADTAENPSANHDISSSPKNKNPLSNKRKASSTPEDEEHRYGGDGSAKRARAEHHDGSSHQPSPSASNRRNSAGGPMAEYQNYGRANHSYRAVESLSKEEEKKRGKRLFGGLLSTLSQRPSANDDDKQKRRQEIDRRQQERVRKQKTEADLVAADKRAKVNEVKNRGRLDSEEKAMKTRHETMLANAHSLCTKEKPPIHYRPRRLTHKQEKRIDDQIKAAKAAVAREVDEFNRRKQRQLLQMSQQQRNARRESSGRLAPVTSAPRLAPGSSAMPKPASGAEICRAGGDTTDDHAKQSNKTGGERPRQNKPQGESSGDIVADNAEDVVLY